MKFKNRFLALVGIVVLFVIGVTGFAVYRDFQNRLLEAKTNILRIAETQATILETLYEETGDKDLVVSLLTKTLLHERAKGQFTELDLIEETKDSLKYVVCFKKNKLTHFKTNSSKYPVPYPEPNKAEQGGGSIRWIDNSSPEQIFSYHRISLLNWSIVVIQDVEDIRRPFIRNMLEVTFITILLITLAVLMFSFIILPIVHKKQEEEQKFKQLVENINELFFLRNEDKFLYVSPTLTKLLGYQVDDLYEDESLWMKWIHPEDREFIRKSTPSGLKNYSPALEFRISCADGSIKWLQAKTYLVDNHNFGEVRRASVISDITEQRALIAALRQNEAKYRSIFNTCPDAIMVSDMQGHFLDINEVFTQVSGYQMQDLEGLSTVDIGLWNSENERDKALNLLKKNGHFENKEFEFKTKNGNIIICLVSSKILIVEDQVQVISIARDVTERKKIINELESAKEKAEESDKLKTAFLNNISHEFRTPINSIVGFTELITYSNQSKEKQAMYSSQIINGCNKLIEIVNLTVEMSQIQSKQVRYYESFFNFSSLLNRIEEEYSEVAQTKKIDFSIQTNFQSHNSSIFSDFNKLFKTIKYLVDNAIKFTKQGSVCMNCLLDNGHLLVSVQDTGIGISKEMQAKVFDIFRQIETGLSRNFGGNGLGLSIAKAYVEVMNGRIWLESEPGFGTTVYFTVPAIVSKKKEAAKEKQQDADDWSLKTVVIAEDEISNFELLSEFLLPTKIKVLHAQNGEEAVDLVEKNKIDIVLMDIKMPIMDGISATRKIRQLKQDIPIIAITSYTNESNTGQIIVDEFDKMVSKPINGQSVLKIMKTYLDALPDF